MMSIELRIDEHDVKMESATRDEKTWNKSCTYCEEDSIYNHTLGECLTNIVERIKVLENASS